MTELNLLLRNGVFIPAEDKDLEAVHSLKKNKVYKCKITNDRNYLFLKKYHKLFNIAWSGLNEVQSKCFNNSIDTFRKSVEIEAGCCEPVFSFKTMEPMYIKSSIAFDKMSESDFSDLYDRVKDVLINVVFRKCNDEDFINYINEF